VDGVAQVRIGGQQRYAMRVWLDRDALAARGITVNEIEKALSSENVELPAGRIESNTRDFTLRVARSYQKPEDFAQIPLGKGTDGYVVAAGRRGQDRAELGRAPRLLPQQRRAQHWPGHRKISTANSLDVRPLRAREAERIQQTLPGRHQDLRRLRHHHLHRRSVERVYHTLIEAIVLVLIVIWLFLGSVRAALIPAVTVPVCLIARSCRCTLFGYSINLLTLLALVLCIGLVVDDAIVVLENIQRRATWASRAGGRARGTAGGVRGDRDDRGAGRGVPADRLHEGNTGACSASCRWRWPARWRCRPSSR
jgi:multidrug efflux pump